MQWSSCKPYVKLLLSFVFDMQYSFYVYIDTNTRQPPSVAYYSPTLLSHSSINGHCPLTHSYQIFIPYPSTNNYNIVVLWDRWYMAMNYDKDTSLINIRNKHITLIPIITQAFIVQLCYGVMCQLSSPDLDWSPLHKGLMELSGCCL